jgi:hypothetical protein
MCLTLSIESVGSILCKNLGNAEGQIKDCGEHPMDWTDLPFNQILEQEAQEWNKFWRALRKEDQEVFD